MILVLAVLCPALPMRGQTSAFTYQGRISDATGPLNSVADFEFRLFDAAAGGAQFGPTVPVEDVGVTNGLFAVTLDFGASVFDGSARWLDIAVRPGASAGAYTNLAPRQAITSAPYAVRAANLSGVIGSASLSGVYGSALAFTNAGNVLAGSGAALTGLNASQLVSGTVPSAALGNAWQTGGNAGTTSGTHFLGTTDNQPLDLRVNNAGALRLIPTALTPHVAGGSSFNVVSNNLLGVAMGGGGNEFNPQVAGASFVTLAGGLGNGSWGLYGTVGGGLFNRATATASVVGGGQENEAAGSFSTVAGGERNRATGNHTFAAGRRAFATHPGSFVWADATGANFETTASNQFLVRAAGGVGINTPYLSGAALTVAGATELQGSLTLQGPVRSAQALEIELNAQRALRLEPNVASANLVAGYSGNLVSNGVVGAAVLGGGAAGNPNIAGAGFASVLGGSSNAASGMFSMAMGHGSAASGGGAAAFGWSSAASGLGSFAMGDRATAKGSLSVAFGQQTLANNDASVAMGLDTEAGGVASVAFGENTEAGGDWAVAFGKDSVASGLLATALGSSTTAAGTYSMAAGRRAGAHHSGAFVWGDSANADFSSTADNQFLIRAGGGVGINTNNPGSAALFVAGPVHALGAFAVPFEARGGMAGYSMEDRATGAAGRWDIAAHNGDLTFRTGGAARMSINSNGVSAMAFIQTSDRSAKENFRPVDPRAVLEKVAALPLSEWNFKQDPATRHVGPMAQDFHAAFGVGPDDKHIATVDADGVALAAIQGLNQKLESELRLKEARLRSLEGELAVLKTLLARIAGAAGGVPPATP